MDSLNRAFEDRLTQLRNGVESIPDPVEYQSALFLVETDPYNIEAAGITTETGMFHQKVACAGDDFALLGHGYGF